jgi:hypothetical protein
MTQLGALQYSYRRPNNRHHFATLSFTPEANRLPNSEFNRTLHFALLSLHPAAFGVRTT